MMRPRQIAAVAVRYRRRAMCSSLTVGCRSTHRRGACELPVSLSTWAEAVVWCAPAVAIASAVELLAAQPTPIRHIGLPPRRSAIAWADRSIGVSLGVPRGRWKLVSPRPDPPAAVRRGWAIGWSRDLCRGVARVALLGARVLTRAIMRKGKSVAKLFAEWMRGPCHPSSRT